MVFGIKSAAKLSRDTTIYCQRIEKLKKFSYLGKVIDKKSTVKNYRLKNFGQKQLLLAYNNYVHLFLQYGVLVYVSTDRTKQEHLKMLLKRLIKTISQKKFEPIKDKRQQYKYFTVKE